MTRWAVGSEGHARQLDRVTYGVAWLGWTEDLEFSQALSLDWMLDL